MKTIQLLIILFVCSFHSTAQVGSLDPDFGNNGIVITEAGDSTSYNIIRNILPFEDHSFLATGHYKDQMNSDFYSTILIKYDVSGEIDTSFGDNGMVRFVSNQASNVSWCSKLQSNGKILNLSNRMINDFSTIILTRLNSDGSIDNTFGNNGQFIYENVLSVSSGDFEILPNDDIIISIQINNDFGVLKLSGNGSIDTSFGTNGMVSTNLFAEDRPTSLAIQPDGKIVVGGYCDVIESDSIVDTDPAIIRYLPNGTLDSTFNNSGYWLQPLHANATEFLSFVKILDNGKIIFGGDLSYNENYTAYSHFFCARLTENGTLDAEFGDNGYQEIYNITVGDFCFDGLIQPDGKIIMGGFSIPPFSPSELFLVRVEPNGTLDSTFGNNGFSLTNINNNRTTWGLCMSFNEPNRVLLAGTTGNSGLDLKFLTTQYILEDYLIAEDVETENRVYSLTPNPAQDYFVIHGNESITEKANIQIYSHNGILLKTIAEIDLNNQTPISIEDLHTGVYLVKLISESDTQVLKLIKK